MRTSSRLMPAALILAACSQAPARSDTSANIGSGLLQGLSDAVSYLVEVGIKTTPGVFVTPALPANAPATSEPPSPALEVTTGGDLSALSGSSNCLGIVICLTGAGDHLPAEPFALSTSAASGTFYSDSTCSKPTKTAVSSSSDAGTCAGYQAYYADRGEDAAADSDALTMTDSGTMGYAAVTIYPDASTPATLVPEGTAPSPALTVTSAALKADTCTGISICLSGGSTALPPELFALSSTSATGKFYSDASCATVTTTALSVSAVGDKECTGYQAYYLNSAVDGQDVLTVTDSGTLGYGASTVGWSTPASR